MNNTQSSSRFVAAALIALLPSVAAATIQAQSAKGDGITVHGHWIVDVRNADGGLASHNEFENALEPSGAVALTGLLARNLTPAAWRLDLIGANNSGGPCVKAAPATQYPTLTIMAPGAVFNSQTNTWDWQPTPGAPIFVGGTAYSQQTLTQSQFSEILAVSDPEGDPVFVFVGSVPNTPPIPGLVLTGQPPNSVLQLDLTNASAGTYENTFRLQDPNNNSNVYTFIVTIPAPGDPTASGSYPCSAVEPSAVITTDLANAWFPTLAFNLVPIGNGSQNLEVSGNVTVSTSESIEQVRSVLVMSNSATLPFSSRVLPTPIQVVPGQKVYVKVAFSFS